MVPAKANAPTPTSAPTTRLRMTLHQAMMTVNGAAHPPRGRKQHRRKPKHKSKHKKKSHHNKSRGGYGKPNTARIQILTSIHLHNHRRILCEGGGTAPPQQRKPTTPRVSRVKHPPDKARAHAHDTSSTRNRTHSHTQQEAISREIDRGRPPDGRRTTCNSKVRRTTTAQLHALKTSILTHARTQRPRRLWNTGANRTAPSPKERPLT